MKVLESKIFDAINSVLSLIQSKTYIIKNNSFLLSNIDFFILISIAAVYIVSTFCNTAIIGTVSFLVPFLVTLKVFMTKDEKIELEQCNFYLIIYLLICLITNFTSFLPVQSLYGFMKTLIYFAFYFALCQFLKENRRYIIILLFIIAALISIESIIGLIQNMAGVENISTWQDTSYVNPEDILSRIYGTLKPYNPNLYAGYLIAGFSSIAAFLAISIKNRQIKIVILAFCCFTAAAAAILLTGCRGAYLALFVILIGIIFASFQIIFFDIKTEKLKKIWKIIVSCFAACSIGFMYVNHGIFKRFMSMFLLRGDSSTSFRMNVYHSAFQMFHDNWLCGIGVGNKVFREIYGLYMLSGFDALSCYCVFLEMAVESGIFALIVYILFLFSLLSSAVKNFFNSSDFENKIILFVSFISIAAVMFHGFFDTIYFRPQIQYIFWTMAAIITVLVRENRAE
ncbi:MAG: O-antigen ligase family protein [Candidatus Gastranaerophilales bacterium]|nr:O-antigen ligase family protein [Candidatus Gastranaerophilales bacterium]